MILLKTDSYNEPAVYVAGQINSKLSEGQRVLWLVPGGSAIGVATEASRLIKRFSPSQLTISLTDERYGLAGHRDSNEFQLTNAGFNMRIGNFISVLNGESPEVTTRNFSSALGESLKSNDYSIGLFGLGEDGHTAGIKPGSSAVNSLNLAEGFTGDDFERITITPTAIKKMDEAVVYAIGESKHAQIQKLLEPLSTSTQPAQVLKKVPKLTIFNDFKGGSL